MNDVVFFEFTNTLHSSCPEGIPSGSKARESGTGSLRVPFDAFSRLWRDHLLRVPFDAFSRLWRDHLLRVNNFLQKQDHFLRMSVVVPQWYALYLRSRYEKKVALELERKNIEQFLPLIEEVHVWSDRKKKVMEPLFRGYIFVRTDLRDRETILRTDGVIRFVGIRNKPSRIPELHIGWLRRVVGQAKEVQRESYLDVGERVRIVSGPFMGIEGIVNRVKGSSRVIVPIAAVQQSVSFQVSSELLEIIRKSDG